MYKTRKSRAERAAFRSKILSEWKVFMALGAFFSFTYKDVYAHLLKNSDIYLHYKSLASFNLSLHHRPTCIMNKESIRKAVIYLSSRLKEDAFTAFEHPEHYDNIKNSWKAIKYE